MKNNVGKFLLAGLLTASLSISTVISAKAEVGNTTFTSLYGSNGDNTDAYSFATAIKNFGWTGITNVKGTLLDFKNARDRNLLY